jgi:hypothetical protein
MRNRIINGAMVIDQRNAGASVTPISGQFLVDRWGVGTTQSSKFTVQQNAGSVTPPTGFTNYLGVTSSSAYAVLTGDTFLLNQVIEGFNTADLGWGTANAKTITLSFWVRSSLTGTFGGALTNNASNRSYPFSYSVPAANTWFNVSITIAGDTTGTWLTNNETGIRVRFGLGSGATFSGTAGAWTAGNLVQPTGTVSVVGTNGATWYITGVQFEVGTQATSFEYRQYQQELALCQRYLPTSEAGDIYSGYAYAGTALYIQIPFKVLARVAPTGITAVTFGAAWNGTANYYTASGVSYVSAGGNSALVNVTVPNNFTLGQGAAYQAPKILFNGCEL